MTVFNEYRNKYIVHTVELVNKIAGGAALSEQDIRKSFEKHGFNELIFGYIEALMNVHKSEESNFGILNLQDKNNAKLEINARIPIRPLLAELIWLTNMFEDKRIRLFLGEEIIKKLFTALKEKTIPMKRYSKYFDFRNCYVAGDEVETSEFVQKFRVIYEAIQNREIIQFSNIDSRGNKYEKCQAVPFRIEYSNLEGRFRVSLFSFDQNRPIKANMSRLYDVSVCKECKDIDREYMLAAIDNRKVAEPIIMEVKNEKNVIERCFSLFSCYERRAYIREDGLYILEIIYYEFEMEEIITKILSLGLAVRVIYNDVIMERICRRLHLD